MRIFQGGFRSFSASGLPLVWNVNRRAEVIYVVWEFIVKKDAVAEFERVYGPDGTWARLFAGHPGFRGTTLLRDEDTPRRYLTIDAWETDGDRRGMLAQEKVRYGELDAALADLTESEDEVGNFVSVPAAAPFEKGPRTMPRPGDEHSS